MSQLRQFARLCEERSGRRFPDQVALHDFSVGEFREFWGNFLSWSGLLTEGTPDPVCTGDECEQASFFPQLRLSYAENLLRIDSPEDAERIAVVAYHPFRPVERLTRRDLHDRVLSVAGHLRRLGVGPGDRVAAVSGNNVEVLVGALAAATVGAAFACASPDMGASAVLSRFEQLEPMILMANLEDGGGASSSLGERIRGVASALPSVRAIVALDEAPVPAGLPVPLLRLSELTGGPSDEPEWQRFAFDHPLFILFSSGTTGRPKCIVHGAGGTLLEHVKEHRLHVDLDREDTLFFHTSAAWMMWNWQLSALASGSAIVLFDGPISGPDTLWRVVSDERVSVFGTSPPYLQLCQDSGYSPRREVDLTRLRAVLSTGSILHDWQYDWFAGHVGPMPLQSISGGSDIIGCFVLGHPDLPLNRGWIQSRSLGLDVRALPVDGGDAGGVGELVCCNPFPSRPRGFVGDDGTRFHEAYFQQNPGVWTHGDLIEFDHLGQARMHGRSDGVLNVRGIRIGPAEIYRALGDVREIQAAMAVEQQMPSDPAGARIVLLVVLRDRTVLDAVLSARIRREIERKASPAHLPGLIVQVPELPTTHSGKSSERAATEAINGRSVANRQALRNPDSLAQIQQACALADDRPRSPGSSAASAYAPPGSDLERSLGELWQRLLQRDRVGIDDDFFELGGHSLLAIQLVHAIERELGRTCTLSMLFRNRTIRHLAAELHAGGPEVTTATLLPLQPEGDGQPLFCINGVHVYQELSDRLGLDAPVYGIFLPIEQELFELDPGGRDTKLLSAERMAADYVHAIREQQPQGPYQLMGFSFGGVLAYEVAQQLTRAGEDVDMLIMLDSLLPVAMARKGTAARLGRWLSIGIRGARTGREQLRRVIGRRSIEASAEGERLNQLRLRIYLDATNRYEVSTYSRPVLLIRCESTIADAGKHLVDPTYGWGEYISQLEICDLPGDHQSVLRRPHVDALANAVRSHRPRPLVSRPASR